jgi:hypothetical protein
MRPPARLAAPGALSAFGFWKKVEFPAWPTSGAAFLAFERRLRPPARSQAGRLESLGN